MGLGSWYTIVQFGSDPAPARGPYRSLEDAEAAFGRFRERYGFMAGTWLAAGSVQIRGPFSTRRVAQEADISESTEQTERGCRR